MRIKHIFSSLVLIAILGGCQGNSRVNTDASKTVKGKSLPELVGHQDAVRYSQGNFEDAERPTSGTVEVAQSGEIYHVVLGSDFQASKGPDLQLVLHRSKNLRPELSPPSFPLKQSNYVVLGRLKSLNGQQTYAVPENVNIDEYGSVAIWCQKFNATFGTANLVFATQK